MNELLKTFSINGEKFTAEIEFCKDKPMYLILNGTKIDRFKLLALADKTDNEKRAWEIMKIASILFHPQDDETFNALYGCVALNIAANFTKNEYYIHSIFKKNIKKLLGDDVAIADVKNNQRHIPDAWVKQDDQLIPVEMKLKLFDLKALTQLKRYMDFYKSSKGIAVGSASTVILPANITFISIKQIEGVAE